MKLKVGMRVRGTDSDGTVYTGTVYIVDGTEATIKRDDNISGKGVFIPDYPYNGRQGWRISKNSSGTWGGDGDKGTLEILSGGNTSKQKAPVQPLQVRGHTPHLTIKIGCMEIPLVGAVKKAHRLQTLLKMGRYVGVTQIPFNGQNITLQDVEQFLAWCKQAKIK